jgi:hypothetical protein
MTRRRSPQNARSARGDGGGRRSVRVPPWQRPGHARVPPWQRPGYARVPPWQLPCARWRSCPDGRLPSRRRRALAAERPGRGGLAHRGMRARSILALEARSWAEPEVAIRGALRATPSGAPGGVLRKRPEASSLPQWRWRSFRAPCWSCRGRGWTSHGRPMRGALFSFASAGSSCAPRAGSCARRRR